MMPVVVMQGGGSHSTLGLPNKRNGPNSHICIAVLVLLLINPLFGLIAVFCSCWSLRAAAMDWEGARCKGRIALWMSVTGVVTSLVAVVIYVLVVFTKDS